jgi:two-component system phosphate regulon response regulator PhoB
MARILAIDEDSSSRQALARHLEPHGHRVIGAGTGSEGVRLARSKRPELVLLGQKLPDRKGLDVCKVLKGDPATEQIQIVLLLDRPDSIERAVAHELGVLDYLVKPFTPGALVARVEASCARSQKARATESEHIGCLTLGSNGRCVSVGGDPVDLTPVELALLLVLCDGGERVHTRVELRERVWGEVGPDDTRLVDQYVKRLRKKLGKAGLYIETVHGVGYRFAKGRAERERDPGAR